MSDFFLVTCYTPTSQDELRRLDYRMTWEDDFRAFLHSLEAKGKPVIVCGDLNVAHKEIDIKNPKTNRRNAGFTDTWRYFNPDLTDVYSWWSYRFRAREKNTGWRIDYFLTSSSMNDRLVSAAIHTEIFGSDHCPVELVIK